MGSESEPRRKVTRGHGVLEPFLARMRARLANRIIPANLRAGRILDIGCGSLPYFLSHTSFKEKFAVDQLNPHPSVQNVTWHTLDLNHGAKLPFDDGFFDVVTMLAVVEHLNPSGLAALLREVNRVLRPGGQLVITTPAAWSDGLLRWMSRVNLVSPEEINEHKYAYTLPLLGWYFGAARFDMDKLQFGYFECGLNLWATAQK